jgi:hypothetical protein
MYFWMMSLNNLDEIAERMLLRTMRSFIDGDEPGYPRCVRITRRGAKMSLYKNSIGPTIANTDGSH